MNMNDAAGIAAYSLAWVEFLEIKRKVSQCHLTGTHIIIKSNFPSITNIEKKLIEPSWSYINYQLNFSKIHD